VGVAGEDRSEVSNAGVDPATRGRRLDEALMLVRRLTAGEEVTFSGEFFRLEAARILPPTQPPIPIVIGGRGDAAVRRTAALGDGWLGMFCSARRFAETRQQILDAAAAHRPGPAPSWFGLSVWCGLGASASQARELLAAKMERLYRLPYGKFQHLAPAGTPPQVAEFLHPYVEAGARHITLVPAAQCVEEAIDAAAEVAALLRAATAAKAATAAAAAAPAAGRT
jgi:alkanesulfonate monooxygenase SsuD/methylene tetrahydromethanopterin reductase-like flavin-dependent oxidoreductase (luciferase family)